LTVLDIRAYGDESDSPRHFVLTCVFAPFATWELFGDDWSRLLERESYLTDDEGHREFKAHDCVQGAGKFRDLDDDYRQRLYREFAEVIQRHHLSAAATVVDIAAWPTFAEILRPLGPTFEKPWTFAFAQLVPLVVRLCPPGERIAFLFDDQKEFASKAYEGFHSFKYKPHPIFASFSPQLGRIAFDDSRKYPALQAADLLGYEVRLRMRIERLPRQSWERTREQMTRLVIGVFGHGVANRWAAMGTLAEERGLHLTGMSPEQMAEIASLLPPLEPSDFGEGGPPLDGFVTKISDIPTAERQ
jgi:Protein of unknown function (DUF3800)